MKYVSIDLETTGLDENEHQIIELGAIIEDSKNPKSFEESKKFRRIVLASDHKYVGSSIALAMNADLIKTISLIENGGNPNLGSTPNLNQGYCYIDDLLNQFKFWLLHNGFKENSNGVLEIVAAGKNFASFDKKFIEAIPDFKTWMIRFHHRSLDPTLRYIDWEKDEVAPGTDLCKTRSNMQKGVEHHAIDDAWDVIKLLRPAYHFDYKNSAGTLTAEQL